MPSHLPNSRPKREISNKIQNTAVEQVKVSKSLSKSYPRKPAKKCDEIGIGKIVLAKQKYSVPWPSRIVSIHKSYANVYFLGDGRIGSVKLTDIYEFRDSADEIKRCISSQGSSYGKGIREAEIIIGIPEHLSVVKNDAFEC